MKMSESISLDILCKNIQSTERSVRQSALKELLKIASKEITIDLKLEEIIDATLLFLIKCYTDRFESCRSLAASVFSQFIVNIPKLNDRYLDYIVPTLHRRIGMPEIIEESEELRLQLVEQVHDIVKKFTNKDGKDYLMNSYNDLVDIIIKTLTDPFTNVQRTCCEIIIELADSSPTFPVKAESLVDPLILLLSHRQSATRISAIQALTVVSLHIDNKNDNIVKSIVSISPLLMDSVPAVRRECGRTGCKWLIDLPDRYSFFDRILPLVLCCLNDETPDIQNEISAKFLECGQKYYNENETELQKTLLADREPPCSNYSELIALYRPTIGCRALIQRSLRITTIILHELQDWKEEVRIHSLRLLWQIILHAEKSIMVSFLEILPILTKCCQDNVKTVVIEAKRVVNLLGRLMYYNDFIEHVLKQFENHSYSLGALRCLSWMFAAANKQDKSIDVERIGKLLSNNCSYLDTKRQMVVLDIAKELMSLHIQKEKEQQTKPLHLELDELAISNCDDEKFESKIENEERYIFKILVLVLSFTSAHDECDIENRAQNLMKIFSKTDLHRMTLNAKYIGEIVNEIEDLDCEHTERSERILLLYGIIKFCGIQIEYFDAIKNAIKMVLDNSETSAKVKILTGIAIAMLKWNKDLNLSKMESERFLGIFVDEIVAPILVWRAGINAEVMRTIGTQILVAIAENAEDECKSIFGKYIPLLTSLAEDHCAITRIYAIKCLIRCGPLSYEDYRQTISTILNGFDDPCSDVRILAVECIGKLELEPNCDEFKNRLHHTHLEYALKKLILHSEDPYVELKAKIMDSIKAIALSNREVFMEGIQKLPSGYPHSSQIDKIKMEISE